MKTELENKEDFCDTEIDHNMMSWTENDTDYTLYEHCVNVKHGCYIRVYYIHERDFIIKIKDGNRIKKIIDEHIQFKSSDEVIELLSEPTIVRISGYKGEIPESPFTVTIDGKNVQTQICNNTIYNHYGVAKTLRNLLNRLLKVKDTRSGTIVVEQKKLDLNVQLC